ncbi:MAG: diacylglycerol/lipid kinase family protein [Gemmatimonadota bacterium]
MPDGLVPDPGVPGGNRPRAGERIAAVAALLCLAAAVVLAALGIATHLPAVVLAIIGMSIATTGCWYVVSRRGAVRISALIVTVLAVAALITGLVFAGFTAWRVAAIIAVATLSVPAARYALRRTARAVRSRRLGQPAASPSHPVLIMNPRSGGGKAERFRLAEECRARGIRAVVLHPGDDLRELAEQAVADGADVLGMAGGDGSQALVADVAARHRIPFVCVPAGTRNHFALDLGLDRRDVTGALDAYSDGAERRVDLATVNGRVFVNNASLGVYAAVIHSPEYRDAKLRTAAAALPGLLGPDAQPLDLRFTGPDETGYPSAHLILVSNNPYQLVHPGGWGTREHMNRGVLGIVAVRLSAAADARRFMALEMDGQVRRFPGWLEWSAPRFQVTSDGLVPIGVDGEALELEPPLVFRSEPGALRVWLPRRAVRPAPASQAVHLLAGSTVADLARVAAGRPAAASRH